MRLCSILPATLALSYASARSLSILEPPAIASSRVERRHLLRDTCLYANSSTLADLHLPPDVFALESGLNLNTCLCVQGLSRFLRSDSRAAVLVGSQTFEEAEHWLGAFINSSALAKTCNYPRNSQPICTREDICGFTCDAPYVPDGDSCVLENHGPCDGADARTSCGAPAKARAPSKRAEVTTFAEAQATCQSHEKVCGAAASVGAQPAFKCVDVQTSLDNCGGCSSHAMIPGPFTPRHQVDDGGAEAALGVDCTAIAHADAVGCASGVCAVESCVAGWVPDARRSTCVRVEVQAEARRLRDPRRIARDQGQGPSVPPASLSPSPANLAAGPGSGSAGRFARGAPESEEGGPTTAPAQLLPSFSRDAGAHKISEDWRIPDYHEKQPQGGRVPGGRPGALGRPFGGRVMEASSEV